MARFEGEPFIDFKFGDYTNTDLGIKRVSNGNRYNYNINPTTKDVTQENTGGWGTYYFKSYDKSRAFTIDFAFDHLTDTQLRLLRQAFAGDTEGDLIFAERPDWAYKAKVTGTPNIKFLGFENKVLLGDGPYSSNTGAGGKNFEINPTIMWNQLVNLSNKQSTTIGELTFEVDNTNYTITVNGSNLTAVNVNFQVGAGQIKANEVYLFFGCPQGGGSQEDFHYRFVRDYGNGYLLKRTTSSGYNFNITIGPNQTVNNLVFKPQIVNLTQMFGATIADQLYDIGETEPAKVVFWFKKLFSNWPYQYDAGTQKTLDTTQIYKGEGQVQFTCYDPYSYGLIDSPYQAVLGPKQRVYPYGNQNNYQPVTFAPTDFQINFTGSFVDKETADTDYIGISLTFYYREGNENKESHQNISLNIQSGKVYIWKSKIGVVTEDGVPVDYSGSAYGFMPPNTYAYEAGYSYDTNKLNSITASLTFTPRSY